MAVSPPQKVCRAALAVATLAAVACAAARPPAPSPLGTPRRLAAGFRFSAYGPDYDPGPTYWKQVGERMAERFPGSVPGAVWIVGRLKGQGCELSFPGRSTDPSIQFTNEDRNEKALDLFDAAGFEVWLQVEPGHAPVETLIDLVLARYRHHPSVVGFGIDVEWYRSVAEPEGQAVTDAEARAWQTAVRAHRPGYRLFLKHWLAQKMPPTAREGLTFIDDSQILPSLDAMVAEFAQWARTFAPAPVGFQIGYDSDRPWWEKLPDPPAEIGRRILEAAPNTKGLYWVDFSVLDVFPPEAPATGASPRAPARPRIGVKIYEHDGDLDALFGAWDELGIDTAFASEALAGAPGFRAKAAERGVDLFLIEPVFYNPQALAEDPSLFAITAAGTPAREEWVEFVCPSRPEYRARRVREIAEAVRRIRPDGLSLDFLRHFVFWEKVPVGAAPDSLPNTCFCDRCVASFAARAGLTIPREALGNPRSAAAWILAEHEAAWTEWKIELVDSMAAALVAAARAEKPDLEIVLHAVPWRSRDYGGAIRRIAGQDHERLAKRFDYLSPMAYAHMLRRPPQWIRSVVRTLAATSGARILPSIQVQEAYRPGEPLKAEEFAQDLREALRPPSAGVVLWSWNGLEKEPEKQLALRSVLAEGGYERPTRHGVEGQEPPGGRVIIAYVFPRDERIDPAEIDADRLTHINYAFANIADGKVVEGFARDAENLRVLADLRRRHPHLRILVSVGGWTRSGGFSDVALTTESRRRFAQSAVDFVRRHDLDGFDVDWEYPGLPGNGNPHRPEDKPNFSALLSELRDALDAEGAKRGRRYLLTFAAGAFEDFLEHTEAQKVQASVDFVNLMTYDFREAGADARAGHHANLYTHPADDKGNSADRAVRDFIRAGVPAHKIVLGVPFYGRAWGDVISDPGAKGLYQPGGPLPEELETRYDSLAANLVGRGGFERHWDPVAQAPYLWSPERRVFVSYDDPESLRLKCRYIRDQGLAGVMFWEYYADRSGVLLHALFDGLRANRAR